MQLELLTMLADNGGPLDITIRKGTGGTQVSRGKKSVEVSHFQAEEMLPGALRHYPRPVRVNGERLETTPAPTGSIVEIMEHDGRNLTGWGFRRLDPAEAEDQPRFSIIAGGVGLYSNSHNSEDQPNQTRYLTPAPGAARHHSPLFIIRTTTTQVVLTKEIGELEESLGNVRIPARSDITLKVHDRRRNTEERTLARDGMPPIYRGEAFEYALMGDEEDDGKRSPAPIRVAGTPVEIGWEYGQEALAVSAADALYHEDHDLVPVHTGTPQHSYAGCESTCREPALAIVKFRMDPPAAGRMESVQSITLSITTEGRETLEVPARFLMKGEFEDEASVRVARDASISLGELQEALMRAYWKTRDWDSNEEEESVHGAMEQRMKNLALHLLGKNESALQSKLLAHAGNFFTMVPAPREPVSVTTPDGRITMTANPLEAHEPAG